jgi:hypothetical protein
VLALSRLWFGWRAPRAVVLALLMTALALPSGPVFGQITFGATLTVLRGSVSVVHNDGGAVAPARTGLMLNAGDRVATVGKSSALVTFFDGSEVELGADTTIAIVDATGGAGNLVSIIIETILGSTVHTVATLTNPGSTYKILAGGTVTEVHGTVIGNRVDGDGNVTDYLLESKGKVTFPGPGTVLHNGQACTYTNGGDLICTQVKGKDVWSALADGVDAGDGKGGAPSNTVKHDEKDSKPDPVPTPDLRRQP